MKPRTVHDDAVFVDRLFEVTLIGGGLFGWAVIAWVTGLPGVVGTIAFGTLVLASLAAKVRA